MVKNDNFNSKSSQAKEVHPISRVLIVDDDVSILTVLRTLLRREGFEVVTADNSEKGLSILRRQKFDLLLSDIVMQPFDGITLLRQARKLNPNNQVIMMTGYATIETATEALKLGAFDYICKPFKIDELLDTVRRAISYLKKLSGTEGSQEKKKIYLIKKHFNEIVGESPQLQSIYKEIERLGLVEDPVWIKGESGTGKCLIAKTIHSSGKRKDFPFLRFNCAICPESLLEETLFGYVQLPTNEDGNEVKGLPLVKKGILELAKGGSVYFEQIGALPIDCQCKLASAISEKKISRSGSLKSVDIDVRIIADTVKFGNLKWDQKDILIKGLYEKFEKNIILLPRLIERKTDISLLIDHFVIHFNQQRKIKISIAPKARKAISNYSWPGNIHELKSTIFRSGHLCSKDQIQLSNLPVPVRMCFMREKTSIFGYTDEFDLRWWSLRKFLKSKEKEYVEEVLKVTKGDKTKAAKLLGISLAAFYNKYGDEQ